jgi:hypothetical protein
MPLPNPSDRRIAGHLAEGLQAVRQKQRPRPHSSSGKRGFRSRVATPYDDDFELLRKLHVRGRHVSRGTLLTGRWIRPDEGVSVTLV